MLTEIVRWIVLICLGYLLLVYGAYVLMFAFSAAEQRFRTSRRKLENLGGRACRR